MIDFNDVPVQRPRIDFDELRDRLASSASDWLPGLLSGGRMSQDRKTIRCADLYGRSPTNNGSAVFELFGEFAGCGHDHSTGETIGPIDVIRYVTGAEGMELFEDAHDLARMDRPAPPPRPVPVKPDHSLEIKRITDECVPLAGTVAETYLWHRGVADPASTDLLFNDDLTDYDGLMGWPGMVALVRDGMGHPTGGIHRTFLALDGSAKAPIERAKRMLGSVEGGHVRLAAMGEDGCLGVAEGIETSLAAWRIFGVPTWAGLSDSGVAAFQWPVGCRRLIIFADAGAAGDKAAAALTERAGLGGISCVTVKPIHGDDFSDDLAKGATEADYAPPPEPEPQPEPVQVEVIGSLTTIADMEAAAAALTGPTDCIAMSRILGAIAKGNLDPIEQRQVLNAIRARTRTPIGTLEQQIKGLRRQANGMGRGVGPRPAWFSMLTRSDKGVPYTNEDNITRALSNAPEWAGVIAFDEFALRVMMLQPPPWQDGPFTPRPWEDVDDTRTAVWLQSHEIDVTVSGVGRAVLSVARTMAYHPVRDYLDGLKWDGVPRINRWTIDYLRTGDAEINQVFGARWLISAVARVMRPGCKVDHMLILEGAQGEGKSTALQILGDPWFSDRISDIGSKDSLVEMAGVWIIEIAELEAMSKAEVGKVKAFLTSSSDKYRPPYGRTRIEVPRQCAFGGSVNHRDYMKDETGGRRFWPLRCGAIDAAGLRRDRDQLWAEAVARYRDGAIWWIDKSEPHLVQAARECQAERLQEDAWGGLITKWLNYTVDLINVGHGGADKWVEQIHARYTPIIDVSIAEVMKEAIKLPQDRWGQGEQNRVAKWLNANGWERYQARTSGGREWRYKKA